MGLNQVAALAGQLSGLVLGGLLSAWDWRAVFWVNVPIGLFFTIWAYLKLRDNGERHPGRIDWWGNATFALGLSAILIAITIGLQPYGGHTMGWSNPLVIGLLVVGAVLLVAFIGVEKRVADPMIELSLFRIRPFTAGNTAALCSSLAQGGLQFILIIWLQGIWLPLHGYDYADTPLWAGIFMLPLTAGFFVAGPLTGALSDRFGARGFATVGMVVFGLSFVGLLLLPIEFPYWAFALLIALNGIGTGMFAAPNTSSIMSSVPARYRGVASGMRSTFQNSGTALSIGVFFSLMIVGLSSSLPAAMSSGLSSHGVPADVAHDVAGLPPVSSLFSAILGVNPIEHLLSGTGVMGSLSQEQVATLTGHSFFPQLLSGPFPTVSWWCSPSRSHCRSAQRSLRCCAGAGPSASASETGTDGRTQPRGIGMSENQDVRESAPDARGCDTHDQQRIRPPLTDRRDIDRRARHDQGERTATTVTGDLGVRP
ncbi:hypothetical protein GCM10027169_11010 [Gordonia jinhuaensis]|uniref:Major facilitator superfamily (MFS) profile domain-containing protein n=1 Tax=Gordonia jinhuaensis TaxID=1517702 RepID=A0A916WPD9_9ACTN|nr:hypothetical protein GCM10011489_05170 [Gordonia jinhuaensis]